MNKFFLNKDKIYRNKGFTLVETLVAISIFTVSIVGMVSLTARGVNNTIYARNKLTSSMLAQEGIEMMRNIRDTAVLTDQNGWTNDFKNKIVTNQCDTLGCDVNPLTLNVINSNGWSSLSKNAEGLFIQNGLTPTIFERKINITFINDDEIEIVSTVRWSNNAGYSDVSVTEHLFNWFTIP